MLDDELMKKAQEGDTISFGLLVQRYQHEALRLANSVVRNSSDAEDIVQDAFLRIYRNRDHYEPRGQFFFFLRRVIINLSLNLLKRRQIEMTPAVEDPVVSSEEKSLENQECVLKALASLDPISQHLLILREWEGMNYQSISEVMEMSLANTKVSLHRAREKFRKALMTYFPEKDLS